MAKKIPRDRKAVAFDQKLRRLRFLTAIAESGHRLVVERPFRESNRARRRAAGDRKGATGRGGAFFGENRSKARL